MVLSFIPNHIQLEIRLQKDNDKWYARHPSNKSEKTQMVHASTGRTGQSGKSGSTRTKDRDFSIGMTFVFPTGISVFPCKWKVPHFPDPKTLVRT